MSPLCLVDELERSHLPGDIELVIMYQTTRSTYSYVEVSRTTEEDTVKPDVNVQKGDSGC